MKVSEMRFFLFLSLIAFVFPWEKDKHSDRNYIEEEEKKGEEKEEDEGKEDESETRIVWMRVYVANK